MGLSQSSRSGIALPFKLNHRFGSHVVFSFPIEVYESRKWTSNIEVYNDASSVYLLVYLVGTS